MCDHCDLSLFSSIQKNHCTLDLDKFVGRVRIQITLQGRGMNCKLVDCVLFVCLFE